MDLLCARQFFISTGIPQVTNQLGLHSLHSLQYIDTLLCGYECAYTWYYDRHTYWFELDQTSKKKDGIETWFFLAVPPSEQDSETFSNF